MTENLEKAMERLRATMVKLEKPLSEPKPTFIPDHNAVEPSPLTKQAWETFGIHSGKKLRRSISLK